MRPSTLQSVTAIHVNNRRLSHELTANGSLHSIYLNEHSIQCAQVAAQKLLPQVEANPRGFKLSASASPSLAAVIHSSTTAQLQQSRRQPPPHATKRDRQGGIVALAGHDPHPMRGRDRLSASRPITSIAPIRPSKLRFPNEPPLRVLLRYFPADLEALTSPLVARAPSWPL